MVPMSQSNHTNNVIMLNNDNNSLTSQPEKDTIKQLNLRWQAIRRWELNGQKMHALNHHLAFSRKVVKAKSKAQNDAVYE